MKLTGISDEAGTPIETQIRAHKELGWDTIEARFLSVGEFEKGSIHEIPEAAFELAAAKLKDAGVSVYAVGSTIGNWAHSIEDPFSITEAEIERCIDRMGKLGSKCVRIMSYAILQDADKRDLLEQHAAERFKRVREIVKRFSDAGIVVVHENCMNYGGMGPDYAREMIAEVPGMKWVFDTGNPVFNRDRNKPEPQPMQDAWEMYQVIKPHIAHVHVKDAIWHEENAHCEYTYPGKGHGRVRDILKDLSDNGYDGYISIEPHVSAVFHDADAADVDPDQKAREQFDSYVRYGRELQDLISTL
ncbi:MAG: sugar phosphate isomerase/epimerase [Verrucomicrobiales bacterium]